MVATVVTSENLAEFQASRMQSSAPVETVAAEEAEPVDQQPISDDKQDAAQDEAQQQEEQKPKKKATPEDIEEFRKRMDKSTWQREEATRRADEATKRADAAESRAKELEAKANPPKSVDADVKPTPGQFTDAFEYAEALAEWSAENALRNRDKAEADKKAVTEREKMVSEWTKRLEATKSEIADYDDALADSDVSVSDPVRDAILESDIGPKILYHLAKNPDIAASLAAKSVTSALRAIGRLEAELSGTKTAATPAVTPSRAPSPISPINATRSVDSPVGSDGEFHGTFAEWKAARASGKIR